MTNIRYGVTTGDVQEFRAMFVGHERSLSHLYETRIQSYVGCLRILYEMQSYDSQWLTAFIQPAREARGPEGPARWER